MPGKARGYARWEDGGEGDVWGRKGRRKKGIVNSELADKKTAAAERENKGGNRCIWEKRAGLSAIEGGHVVQGVETV